MISSENLRYWSLARNLISPADFEPMDSALRHGFDQEAVEAHGVVEERAELVADGLEVGRGEPAPARLLEGHQLVLPPHDVDRGNLVRAVLAQVGEDALRDDGLLGLPGVQARPHVPLVELEEVDELHVYVVRLHGVEVTLPRERLGLDLEAPFHLVGALAVVGLVPGLDVQVPFRLSPVTDIGIPLAPERRLSKYARLTRPGTAMYHPPPSPC